MCVCAVQTLQHLHYTESTWRRRWILFNWRVITHGGPVTLVWDSTHIMVRVCVCVFGAWLLCEIKFFSTFFFSLAFLLHLKTAVGGEVVSHSACATDLQMPLKRSTDRPLLM